MIFFFLLHFHSLTLQKARLYVAEVKTLLHAKASPSLAPIKMAEMLVAL